MVHGLTCGMGDPMGLPKMAEGLRGRPRVNWYDKMDSMYAGSAPSPANHVRKSPGNLNSMSLVHWRCSAAGVGA